MGGAVAGERPLQRKDSGIESDARVSGDRQDARRDEQVGERTYDGFALKELSASGRYLSTKINFRRVPGEERAAHRTFIPGRVFVPIGHLHYEVTYRTQVKLVKERASAQAQEAPSTRANTSNSADGFPAGTQRSPTIRLGKRRRSHDELSTTQSNEQPPREVQQQSRNASVHLLRREGAAPTRRSDEPVRKRIRLLC